ncbi:zinc finger protein 618-like [Aphis craccivora]|uniref:Zinc finger protein 618-like n=1 Tax=Aphis craccivora TaxID=307492 RepID=A0A6G0Y1E3_APHCR|nr:zinc finger protein 618-like [Aphis craccivora]
MYSLEGERFKQFGQFLLDVGAKYGKIDIDDILSHPITVSRHIEKQTKEIRNNIFKDLFFIIKKKYCASTCDMWTDNIRRNIIVYFIQNESKTGENIKRFLYNFFFQISYAANKPSNYLMSSITFVTDQGTNININRLSCSAHLLNTVLRNLFESKYLEHEEFGTKPLEPVITIQNLARFMKTTDKNSQLSKGLVQEVETRWNTRFLMLQSVQNALPEIIQIHGEHFNQIQNINTELLAKITDFLEPFKKASYELEVVLYQLLINKLLQTYANLQENIFTNSEELTTSSILQKLGKRGLEFMDTKFKVTKEHEIAVFLSPKFKSLKMFSDTDKARIIGNIELKLLRIDLDENNRDSQDEHILEFWKNQKHIFPLLSILAKQILTIPASSERSFSVAGRVIEERRSCLDGNTVDGILFLNNHSKS